MEQRDRLAEDAVLAHAGWVRRIAADLLGEADLADDVVQEAWLAARRRPPRGNLRAWLRAVVVNRVATLRRRADRQAAAVPHLARSDQAPSAEETAERLALARRILAAVEALPEPERTTVRLRYFDGLSIRATAAAVGAPVSTVQSRLDRAHARLRRDLDQAFGGDPRRCGIALAAVAFPMTGGVAAAAAPAAAGVVMGGLGVKLAVKAAAVVIAVALAAVVVREVTRDRPEEKPVREARAVEPPGQPKPVHEKQPEPPDREAPSANDPRAGSVEATAALKNGVIARPAESAKPRWVMRGRILGFLPGDERPFRVEVRPIVVGQRLGAATVFPGGERGRFEVDVTVFATAEPAPEEFEVVVNHPAFIPVLRRIKLANGRTESESLTTILPIDVRPDRAACVHGVVRDAGGRLLAGVEVALYRFKDGAPVSPKVRLTRTDGDGRFFLQTLRTGRHLIVADDPRRVPACVLAEPTFSARTGERVELVLRDGVAISGRVLRAGKPLPRGADVRLEPAGDLPGMPRITWRLGQWLVYQTSGRLVRRSSSARTGEDGCFRCAGLVPGEYRVRVGEGVFGVEKDAVHERSVQAPAGNVDFALGGVPHLFTVSADDASLPRARITFVGVKFASTLLGPEQRAILNLKPGLTHRIRVEHAGFVTREFTLTTREAPIPVPVPIRLERDPNSATLTASVTAPKACPLEQVYFRFEGESAGRRLRFWRVAGRNDGRFEVPGIPPGRYTVRLRVGPQRFAGGYCNAVEQEIEFPSGGRVEARFAFSIGGRIRLYVRDREGRVVDKQCRIVDASGRELKLWFVARGAGSAGTGGTLHRVPVETDPPLPPGRYTVEFTEGRPPRAYKTIPVEVKAGRTTDVEWVVDE